MAAPTLNSHALVVCCLNLSISLTPVCLYIYIHLYFDDNYHVLLVLPSAAFSVDGLPEDIK